MFITFGSIVSRVSEFLAFHVHQSGCCGGLLVKRKALNKNIAFIHHKFARVQGKKENEG